MKCNICSKERGYEPIQKGIKGEEYALKRMTRTRREEETTTPAVPEEEDDFLAV